PSMSAPMDRSMTPRSPGFQGGGGAYAPMSPRSGFASGLMGGLLGAGIGGLLFGHGLFGGGGFGFIGLLLQLALLFFIGRWLFRRFAPRPAMAGAGMGSLARMAQPTGGGMPIGGGTPSRPVTVSPADYQAFERTLQDVQAAWSAQDMARLQSLATPEMVSYFAEQLSGLVSRGLRNSVSDVRLDQGDLSEAWSEGNREYATVAMRFSMVDVTRDSAGRVVDGDPAARSSATELWTFTRTSGGRWILSAIQQGR
ncbi:MAG: Tim44 domain-containing protein, partial [Pseudomonadota bacterium]|nr:Tim44 domain-containing protein [Pseudomonadota bacterium]